MKLKKKVNKKNSNQSSQPTKPAIIIIKVK